MKKLIVLLVVIAAATVACNNSKEKSMKENSNPLLQQFDTPHGTIPFDKIKPEHYLPALKILIAEAEEKINKIVDNPDAPTFENTILAMETGSSSVRMTASIFGNMLSYVTNDELQQIAQQFFPMLTALQNKINMNEGLFKRIKTVYEKAGESNFTVEQKKLVENYYKEFIRSGANLNEADKKRFAEIQTELSKTGLQYSDNILKETNAYELHITEEKELAGLPGFVKEGAAFEAKKRNKEGWVFTLHYPSFGPFLKFSENRKLREAIFRARGAIGNNNNENNNLELIRKIVNLRFEMANLLGYKSYADYVLEERMSENRDRVNGFLGDLHEASHPHAEKEFAAVQQYAKNNGADFELQAWDKSYYSDKLKKEKYGISDEMTKPYFELGNVTKGVFELANRLYGITFKEIDNIAKYHEEVQTYEVYDEAGKILAVLYMDFFPRESKRGGAWCGDIRPQSNINGEMIRPLVAIGCNFSKPTETMPSLLTFGEVTTYLHEFGHALHIMLSRCTHPSLSGTSVLWDFVELPSQVLENWAVEKEWLDLFAVHYKTGEKIPQELIQKIVDSKNYDAGSFSERQLSLGMLDMAWYTMEKPFDGDVIQFERAAMAPTQLFPVVEGASQSTSFSHIFDGGYAAGYYSYKWAEVLDADAFSVFKEKGIFDKETATAFRKNILEKGGSEHPMVLYRRFRGQEPTIDGLLERSGLK